MKLLCQILICFEDRCIKCKIHAFWEIEFILRTQNIGRELVNLCECATISHTWEWFTFGDYSGRYSEILHTIMTHAEDLTFWITEDVVSLFCLNVLISFRIVGHFQREFKEWNEHQSNFQINKRLYISKSHLNETHLVLDQ